MSEPLPRETLKALASLDACTLANAIETFNERLRNEGFVDHTVQCLFPHLPPMLGYAVTLRIRGSQPPTADGLYTDRTDWWDYVLSLPAPRIAVVEDIATRRGLGSLLGAVHVNILRSLGCVGAVTNGAARDIPALKDLGFHVFAGNVAVSHAYVHVVDVGTSVEIGGLTINSGDLIHGDMHGVQSVPLELASRIPPVAAQITAREQSLIALCRSPGVSIEQLRAAVTRNA